MLTATVTETRQITLPTEICDRLNLTSGSKIEFVMDEDGQVKLMPLTVPIEALAGILHRPGLTKVSQEQMDRAIAEGANDWT